MSHSGSHSLPHARSHSLLHSLFAHVAWANARVLEALRISPGNDRQALDFFAHILAAEHVWLARVEGRSPKVAVWPALSLEECTALSHENAREYARLLERESDESLERDIAYTNSAGAAFTSRLIDILAHVALHSAYHRGQVALMIRRGDGTPAPTDFIAFVRGVPAATRPGGATT